MAKKNQGSGYWLVFTNLGFMLLFIAQMISYLGDRLDQFTLLELARARSAGNADTVMNNMAICMILPFVLLAPFVGPVVDHFSRKSILIVTSFAQGLVIVSVPFFRHTPFVQENAVAMIYLVILLIGGFTAFFTPAKTALIAEIVPSQCLMAANSLTAFAGTIMNMLGAFVAAEMLHRYGRDLNICFYIDTATYVISGIMFFFILVPATPEILALRRQRAERRESFWRQLSESVKYIAGHARPLKLILLSGAFSTMAGFVYSLLNAKVLGQMGAKTETYGLLMGAFGLALVAGGLAMTLLHRRLPSYEGFAAQAFCAVAVCVCWIAVAGEMTFPISESWAAAARRVYLRVDGETLYLTSAIFPIIAVGLCGGALTVFITTMIQRSVPKRYHGRVFAIDNLSYFIMMIAALAIGSLLQEGVRQGHLSLAAVGMGTAVVALAVAFGVVASTEWLRFKWIRRFAWLLLKGYCRIEIEGRENVPRRGALIVAANHVSWIDTVLIGVAVPRVVHYLTTAEWYDYWLYRPFMKMFGAIRWPEGSGAAGAAGVLKTAIDVVERQRVFGIFPEGRLSPDGTLQEAHEGIGVVARKTQAPILPVALIGAYDVLPRHRRFPRPHKIRVRIGAPIDPRGKDRETITHEVMSAIAALLGVPYESASEPRSDESEPRSSESEPRNGESEPRSGESEPRSSGSEPRSGSI